MITSSKAHIKHASSTHPGMSGKNNEDRFGLAAFKISEQNPLPSLFAVVSDGIGGHQAGEVAAEIAIQAIISHVANSQPLLPGSETPVSAGEAGMSPMTILQDAFEKANRQIAQAAVQKESQQGMGATGVCAWIIGKHLFAGWVGDSRLYMLRNRQIQRLSSDHTWVQEAINHGVIDPAQARSHPHAHILNRYIGGDTPVTVDFNIHLDPIFQWTSTAESGQGILLQEKDILLLCSDGLTDLVDDAEILAHFDQHPFYDVPEKLIALANERGGHDNITIIALEVPTQDSLKEHSIPLRTSRTGRSLWKLPCILLAFLFFLATLVATWWLWQYIRDLPLR